MDLVVSHTSYSMRCPIWGESASGHSTMEPSRLWEAPGRVLETEERGEPRGEPRGELMGEHGRRSGELSSSLWIVVFDLQEDFGTGVCSNGSVPSITLAGFNGSPNCFLTFSRRSASAGMPGLSPVLNKASAT